MTQYRQTFALHPLAKSNLPIEGSKELFANTHHVASMLVNAIICDSIDRSILREISVAILARATDPMCFHKMSTDRAYYLMAVTAVARHLDDKLDSIFENK